jgi:hypothetical protein
VVLDTANGQPAPPLLLQTVSAAYETPEAPIDSAPSKKTEADFLKMYFMA